MREIKFRAWNKESKRMCEEESLASWIHTANNNGIAEGMVGMKQEPSDLGETCLDHLELMQYTGLKDKKTLTDIYECDIIDMEGNIRGNIYESPEVYKSLTTSVVAGMGYEDWENTKQRLVRQGKLIAEQPNLPQILRELG